MTPRVNASSNGILCHNGKIIGNGQSHFIVIFSHSQVGERFNAQIVQLDKITGMFAKVLYDVSHN